MYHEAHFLGHFFVVLHVGLLNQFFSQVHTGVALGMFQLVCQTTWQ